MAGQYNNRNHHSNDSNNDDNDDSTPEAIAKRLRDKIRLQAEALLSRCDDSTRNHHHHHRNNLSRQSSQCNDEDTKGIIPSSASSSSSLTNMIHHIPTSTTTTPTTTTSMANNDNGYDDAITTSSNTLFTPTMNTTNESTTRLVTPSTNTKTDDDIDYHQDDHVSNCTTRSASPSIAVSTSNNSLTTSTSTSTSELTKRIQKLAFERQSNGGASWKNNDLNYNKQRLHIVQNDPTQTHLTSVKTFEELALPTYLLHAIYQMGFNRPSYIQEVTLPRILHGNNIIGQAQSGSGKVRAFVCWWCVWSLRIYIFYNNDDIHINISLNEMLNFQFTNTSSYFSFFYSSFYTLSFDRQQHLRLGCYIVSIQSPIRHRHCVLHQHVNWQYKLLTRRSYL
jgi:hypothetical protein